MSEDQITMQVRPFEKIANDSRWTGAIEGDAYVLRVGPHVYTLRTVGVGSDEKGEFALVEPYEEPFDGGLWLRVEAEPDECLPQSQSAAACLYSGRIRFTSIRMPSFDR